MQIHKSLKHQFSWRSKNKGNSTQIQKVAAFFLSFCAVTAQYAFIYKGQTFPASPRTEEAEVYWPPPCVLSVHLDRYLNLFSLSLSLAIISNCILQIALIFASTIGIKKQFSVHLRELPCALITLRYRSKSTKCYLPHFSMPPKISM